VVPAAAQADPNVDRGVQIARSKWPDSPCAGREQIDVTGPLFTDDGSPAFGLAHPDECRAEIVGTMSPSMLCRTTVHELGHLAGLDHTDAPGDVMNPASVAVPGCPVPFLSLREARGWARNYAMARLDNRRWLTCKRLAADSVRCLWRMQGLRTVTVTVTGDPTLPIVTVR
jgi:hypothetical protein